MMSIKLTQLRWAFENWLKVICSTSVIVAHKRYGYNKLLTLFQATVARDFRFKLRAMNTPDRIKKAGMRKLKKMICRLYISWLIGTPEACMPSTICRYMISIIASPRAWYTHAILSEAAVWMETGTA